MDLDQQAEQAQQKQVQGQTLSPTSMQASHGVMQGQGQGQQSDPYLGSRGYQSNPAVGVGAGYPNPASGGNPPGGRGGLVTYPLPSSGSSSNLKNTSAAFTPSGGSRVQGARTGYGQQPQGQGQGQAPSADFSYGQGQGQGQFSPYGAANMQSQPQYLAQTSNAYSTQQGQGQGQYSTQQQQSYY
jgi:hypothetical protein